MILGRLAGYLIVTDYDDVPAHADNAGLIWVGQTQ
jgi:hypothetical protein